MTTCWLVLTMMYLSCYRDMTACWLVLTMMYYDNMLTCVFYLLQRSKGWGDIPPAPKQDPELKYLELSLDSYNDNDTTHQLSVPPPGQSTPTEYKEIDFVKTKGLQELKCKVQNSRKHEEGWRGPGCWWMFQICVMWREISWNVIVSDMVATAQCHVIMSHMTVGGHVMWYLQFRVACQDVVINQTVEDWGKMWIGSAPYLAACVWCRGGAFCGLHVVCQTV